MFETIKRIYNKTGNKDAVRNAVVKGWITAEEYEVITGEIYAV